MVSTRTVGSKVWRASNLEERRRLARAATRRPPRGGRGVEALAMWEGRPLTPTARSHRGCPGSSPDTAHGRPVYSPLRSGESWPTATDALREHLHGGDDGEQEAHRGPDATDRREPHLHQQR